MVVEADVASKLRDSYIIPQGCQEQISRANGRKIRNELLHEQLVTNCTREALIEACNIFITEEGYPKMQALGEAMKKRLEAGVCVCVCVCVCVFCVHVCVCVMIRPHYVCNSCIMFIIIR